VSLVEQKLITRTLYEKLEETRKGLNNERQDNTMANKKDKKKYKDRQVTTQKTYD
jgi:hypothetical protein